MTDFDRRDVVKLFTALAVLGAFSKPDKAKADGGGLENALKVLIIASIVILFIHIVVILAAFTGSLKMAKVVKDSGSGAKSASQRLRRTKKCGSVKQQGEALFANLNRNCAATIANKRSVKVSIPIPGADQTIELKLRKQNATISKKILAAAKSGGKIVGSVHQDATGLIFNIRSAKLG